MRAAVNADGAAFSVLTEIEHVLARPAMYTGFECGEHEARVFVCELTPEGVRVVSRDARVDRVAAKVFEEILVNASDCVQRAGGTRIDVQFLDDGFLVENDGCDIPVEFRAEWGVYVPHALFGLMRSSSNYDDTRDRRGAGVNGIGCKLANVFSSRFDVVVTDAERRYEQTFSDNMRAHTEPVVVDTIEIPRVARIRVTLDATRVAFGEDTRAVCRKRCVDVAACLGPGVAVTVDGVRAPHVPHEPYGARDVTHVCVPGYDVFVGTAPVATVSFVNGVCTLEHGAHVTQAVRRTLEALGETDGATSSTSASTASSFRRFLTESAFFMVVARLTRPSFRGNEKACVLAPLFPEPAKFGKAAQTALRASPVAETWREWQQHEATRAVQRDEKKRARGVSVPKLDDATRAGTAEWEKCTIILTEGDSAKSFAVAGLAVVGRAYFGAFPLRGKVKNVRDSTAAQADQNRELRALKTIIGLRTGIGPEQQAPRYGRVLVMTDQDVDGFHIKGLLMNFFDAQFPGLIGTRVRLDSMRTPLIKATVGSRVHEFFSQPEYDAWAVARSVDKVKYYKGLGTSTSAEAKHYFESIATYTVRYDFATGLERLRELFSREELAVRKHTVRDAVTRASAAAQQEWAPIVRGADGCIEQTVGAFVETELVQYTSDAVVRCIPSVVDGLKPSQRKVIYTMLKASANKESKVAQLAAHVAQQTAYHHGEASMQQTVVGLAQDFVGSNNVPLLLPIGQFGTRRIGGDDAASARYIFTRLSPVAALAFVPEDFALAPQQEDEGQAIEPRYLLPVIPWILVNGASGIATGFSTTVPPHDPRAVVAAVRAAVLRRDTESAPLHMHVRGFTGTVGVEAARYTTETTVEAVARGHVVTELPVGVWTEAYKETLEKLVEMKRARSFVDESTDTAVRFVVAGSTAAALRVTRHVSRKNMHALDASGALRLWESAEQIVEYFVEHRAPFYARRHEARAAKLEADIERRVRTLRVCERVASGDVSVFADNTGADPENNNGPSGAKEDWLDVPLRACTPARRAALANQIETLRELLASHVASSPTDAWIADLDALDRELASS
jgi:DNA topoisomerase-2